MGNKNVSELFNDLDVGECIESDFDMDKVDGIDGSLLVCRTMRNQIKMRITNHDQCFEKTIATITKRKMRKNDF